MKKRWLAMLVVGCMLIGSMGMTVMAEKETGGENGASAEQENNALASQENNTPAEQDGSTVQDNGTTPTDTTNGNELDSNGSGTIVDGEHTFTIENRMLTKYEGPGGEVTIPEGVTGISPVRSDLDKGINSVFADCNNAFSVKIPSSMTEISSDAFRECTNLTAVTLPEGLTRIGDRAFGNCKSLTAIALPDSATYIGEMAFAYSGLESIIIPGTLLRGGNFFECLNLKQVIIKSDVGVTFRVSEPFQNSAVTDVTVADGVTKIPERMFAGCSYLKKVDLPSSVTSIGSRAFDLASWKEYSINHLMEITYHNTKEQWAKISLGEDALKYGAVVHCTDGDIQIPSSQTTPETLRPEESKPAAEEPRKNSGSSSSHSSSSSNQNNKPAPAPSAPKTEQEVVKETIENLPQGGQAVLETGSVIGSGELRKIMEKGGSMVVFSPQVSWHFDALTNGDMDFNPGIEVGADIPDLMQKLNGQSAASANATVLRFTHNGVLPGAAHAGIAVSYAPGTRLYFYYYNRSTGLFEFQQNVTVENGGYVVVNLTHCSDYVLTTEPLSGNVANGPAPAAGTGSGANGAAQGKLDSTPHTGI